MYRNILVPLAFDHDHTPGRSLEAARALSSPGARVTLLHVMPEFPPYAIYRPAKEDVRNLREAVQAEMDEMTRGFEHGAVVVLEGHAGRTILDWAKEYEPDCIVIASHRPGLQDYFLGSTASHVVRNAACSVHVVR